MGLERDLAEIELLTEEIENRAKNSDYSEKYFTDMNFVRSLTGIKSDSKTLLDKHRSANKSSGDELEQSRYIAEFALDAKNLADNLNIFLQTFYGNYNGNLKGLERNTINAPVLDTGETFYEVHTKTHNYASTSPLIQIRNMKGHGQGHLVVNGSQDPLNGKKDEWLDLEARAYLGMTRDILKTIAEKETEKLAPRKIGNRKSVLTKMFKNWSKRHRTPVIVGATASLVLGTIFGTLGLQNALTKDRLIYEGDQIRILLSHMQLESTEGAWARGLGEKGFNQIKQDLEERTKSLGITARKDAYLIKAAIQNSQVAFGKEIKEPTGRAFTYLKRLEKFKEDINKLEYNFDFRSVHDLSLLLQEERFLIREEGITSLELFPYIPVPHGSEGVYRWIPKKYLNDFLINSKSDSAKAHFSQFKQDFEDRIKDLGNPVKNYRERFYPNSEPHIKLGNFIERTDDFKNEIKTLRYSKNTDFLFEITKLFDKEKKLYEEQKNVLINWNFERFNSKPSSKEAPIKY